MLRILSVSMAVLVSAVSLPVQAGGYLSFSINTGIPVQVPSPRPHHGVSHHHPGYGGNMVIPRSQVSYPSYRNRLVPGSQVFYPGVGYVPVIGTYPVVTTYIESAHQYVERPVYIERPVYTAPPVYSAPPQQLVQQSQNSQVIYGKYELTILVGTQVCKAPPTSVVEFVSERRARVTHPSGSTYYCGFE